MAPRRPKMAPRRPKMAPRWAGYAPRRLSMTPGCSKTAPRRSELVARLIREPRVYNLFFPRKTILFETLKFPSWHQFSIDFGIGSDVWEGSGGQDGFKTLQNEPKTADDGLKLETPLGERSDQDESTWIAYEVLFTRCRDSSRWLPKKIYS